MSTDERHDLGDPAPADATGILRDDLMIDALIAGEAPDADDELAQLLAAWRDDLDTDLPTYALDDLPRTDRARRRRRLRTLVVVAVAVAGIGAGATAAAANAGPDSPLWPLAKVAFPHRADARVAEQQARDAIALSRQAVTERRYDDAQRLLAEATGDTGRIQDRTVVDALLDQIAAVRSLLPGQPAAPGRGGGTGPGATSGPSTGPSGTAPPGTSPTPGPSSTAPGGTLPLPIPLPTISLPGLPVL